MIHERADRKKSTEGTGAATSTADQERSDAYVVQLIREHGPYAAPLAAALKTTGHAHDPEVFAALHRVLGNSLAQNVIAKATATTTHHAAADKGGAHATHD